MVKDLHFQKDIVFLIKSVIQITERDIKRLISHFFVWTVDSYFQYMKQYSQPI